VPFGRLNVGLLIVKLFEYIDVTLDADVAKQNVFELKAIH